VPDVIGFPPSRNASAGTSPLARSSNGTVTFRSPASNASAGSAASDGDGDDEESGGNAATTDAPQQQGPDPQSVRGLRAALWQRMSKEVLSDDDDELKDWAAGELLGRGAFGSVHKCMDRSTGKIFAGKKLNFAHIKEEDMRSLVRELKTLRKLSHPHIVSYRGYVEPPILLARTAASSVRDCGCSGEQNAMPSACSSSCSSFQSLPFHSRLLLPLLNSFYSMFQIQICDPRFFLLSSFFSQKNIFLFAHFCRHLAVLCL